MDKRAFFAGILSLLAIAAVPADSLKPATRAADTDAADRMLAGYFRDETAAIAKHCLADIKSLDDWTSQREQYRRQLAEMLGLWPMPSRTDLNPTITGRIENDEFIVERLHFQSMPHLYVTANLYLPKNLSVPAPAILYVCGHSEVKKNGVSYGNKTAYQHHGAWFARNGYVCLVLDTLQLGEIEGIHHGTYDHGMWWWHSRGYTPAGVEAWNGIRALDYLSTRPEVDMTRVGMTGRSGGGAYTWWVAALDDRIKVAAPVAGITDLQNHVVDGCVEGHCDCMYMVNTYRWDFAQVAALVAPRPLLICNTDKDSIFPLDGVYRLHEKVRRIYRLYGADKDLGLIITEGPHKDTQELQVPVFRWFNRFLKNDQTPIEKLVKDFFEPAALKVFDRLPDDQVNTAIQETFVPAAPPPQVPGSAQAWARQRDQWMAALKQKTFAGWPDSVPTPSVRLAFSAVHDGLRLRGYDFLSQRQVPLRLYVADVEGRAPKSLVLIALDEQTWPKWLATMRAAFDEQLPGPVVSTADSDAFDRLAGSIRAESRVMAWVAPRGIGPTAWNPDRKKQTQVRRRFALLGQTLDGMRVYDLRRAMQALRATDHFKDLPLELGGNGRMAGIALYASLFEPDIAGLELCDLPASHRQGPDLLSVLKTLDLPAAVALAAERCPVQLINGRASDWGYPQSVAAKLGWGADRVKVAAGKEN